VNSRPQASSPFFYFVAAALGISFTAALLILAWNNAIRNETRNFAFDAIALRNSVESNVRTADAVIDALASFVAIDAVDRFDAFAGSTLRRYDFISGVAQVRVLPGGTVEVLHAAGALVDPARAAALTAHGEERILRQGVAVGLSAVPVVGRATDAEPGQLFLVQATSAPAAGPLELALLSLDLAGLVGALAVEPAVQVALYTESEGVAGRQLVYRKASQQRARGHVVESLGQEATVRLDRFSLRLITAKNLLWQDIEKGLIFVALVLGAGITLLLIALARAKDLQARELEARNRVIEEQVRQQTHELAEARDHALAASRVKSDFLASMSHEIRTPLNAIIGMAELLSETTLTDEQQNYVGVLRNAGEALLSLVNDILDLSKIEAEQLVLEHIEFNLHDLVEQCADILALKADGKGLELVSSIAPEVPESARGDPGRLRQILLNLIGNAVKFTSAGAIVIRAARLPAGDAVLRLRFEVEDSGIGIPADKVESIFASFTQVDSSTTRKYGGTGLGLAISKRLVDKMNGRIWVESIEGRGSTFKFEVTLGAVAGADRPAPVSPYPASVLLVDDQPALVAALRGQLGAVGIEVDEVSTLAQARERLAARQAQSRAPAVMVLDADLAGAGMSALIALRVEAGPLPAILLFRPSTVTAGIEALRALPATAYAVKPIKRGALLRALAGLGVPGATERRESAPAPAQARPAARVLLVEDNVDNRLLIKAYLKQQPLVVVEAEDGAVAVQRYAEGGIDLVLMDVQMPVMDGYAATQAIRTLERERGWARVPVVALTANAVKEDVARSRAAGCDDHLTKPIKKQTLLDAIEGHLARTGSGTGAH